MPSLTRRFNLVDEKWIPTENGGLISLRDVFSSDSPGYLDASPVEKAALLKFFLAIAQAACTPRNALHWAKMGPLALGRSCLEYLETWHDAFWLFGEKPFLQLPQADAAIPRPQESLLPRFVRHAAGLLREKREGMSDADRALLVLVLCGFGLGGRHSDNNAVLSPGYTGKRGFNGTAAPGRPGALLGTHGYLHHFLQGETLLHTLWFNLLTLEDIENCGRFPAGAGVPPWEAMPVGEDCPRARRLKSSLMGRLLPMSKFCLLCDELMHLTDGIAQPGYSEGWFDTSIAAKKSGGGRSVLWATPEHQPWRHLVDLLGFMGGENKVDCYGIRTCLTRISRFSSTVGFWAGGMGVTMDDGEQEAAGPEAMTESILTLPMEIITPRWYGHIRKEMAELRRIEAKVYATVLFQGKFRGTEADIAARAAVRRFWKFCDSIYPCLFRTDAPATREALRRSIQDSALKICATVHSESHKSGVRLWKRCDPGSQACY